jgi:predicted XRE-type DNA-binding protein/phage-related protein
LPRVYTIFIFPMFATKVGEAVSERPVVWLGTALRDLRAFRAAVRRAMGRLIRRLQEGNQPSDWKPLASVGRGVVELRTHVDGEQRAVVIARFAEAVYVLHVWVNDDRVRKPTAVVREPSLQPTPHVTPAGGNIFRDLGFPAPEAENLKIRSDLMSALQRLMKERSLTQVQAAKLFGVSQPRISDLKRDKIDRFTIDTLVNMLAHAGVKLSLRVRRSAA